MCLQLKLSEGLPYALEDLELIYNVWSLLLITYNLYPGRKRLGKIHHDCALLLDAII